MPKLIYNTNTHYMLLAHLTAIGAIMHVIIFGVVLGLIFVKIKDYKKWKW